MFGAWLGRAFFCFFGSCVFLLYYFYTFDSCVLYLLSFCIVFNVFAHYYYFTCSDRGGRGTGASGAAVRSSGR